MTPTVDNAETPDGGKDIQPADQIGLDAIPGLARVAAGAWYHGAEWSVRTGLRASRRLLQAAVSAESAATLASDLQSTAVGAMRDLIGVTDLEDRVRSVAPRTTAAAQAVADRVSRPPAPTDPNVIDGEAITESHAILRARGAGLLRQSSDVRYEEDAHPAYDRILTELAPDEGRILRLLLREGPQPSVDVRTGGPIGMFSSELIAPGLSMIGARAGLRYVDRVPSYLNNLFRLGMIWFSRETLRDAHRYQVIEAQPDVLDAMHSVRFAKLVRRSIHLTPFGIDFCRDCLALEIDPAMKLPVHSTPAGKAAVPQPPALTE
jgi:hypothetical protein